MNEGTTALLTKLYQGHFGKMLSALMYHTGIKDITLAEDMVQEAFAIAAEKWKQNLPDQPEAWLYKTIRNIAYNTLKKEGKKRKFEEDDTITADDTNDEQLLKVLYVCVQSSFSAKIQLVVALRYINGLQVKRIAALLGTDEDSISKILYRWRAKCKTQQWDFQQEVNFHQERQVKTVLKIIYVMFTEGFRVSATAKLTDQALCEDALSLLQSLIKHNVIAAGAVKAMYALLLYHLARSCSRLNDIDELVEFAQQDRSCWNQEMIAVANNYLLASKAESKKENVYQLEAAIAYLHTSAANFAAINWLQITQLYAQLQKIYPSPFTQLNYAAALYFAGQHEKAIEELQVLQANQFFRHHYLLHCFWAKVYRDQQNFSEALRAYQKALQGNLSSLEKQFIHKKMQEIAQLN